MGFPDFSHLLHELRTRELRKMPPGARVFLSAGCAGGWYFDWIGDNYPGINRHLGIEAYAGKPDGLPDYAEWLADHIHDMKSVADGQADMVFAGQTIEHLWPDELSGFLCESHRVLRDGGWLVIDSPTRAVAQALNWFQPEHTMEFNVDEIVDLAGMAGFHDVSVRGLWLCYDRDSHEYMPLEPDLENIDIDTDPRVIGATERPEDSFVWWVEARKNGAAGCDRDSILKRAEAIYHKAFSHAVHREFRHFDTVQGYADSQTVSTVPGQYGYLRHGPYIPLRPGRYVLRFVVGVNSDPTGVDPGNMEALALKLQITSDMGHRLIAEKDLSAASLIDRGGVGLLGRGVRFGRRITGADRSSLARSAASDPHFRIEEIEFTAEEVLFGIEFKALTTGVAPVVMRSSIQLIELGE